jgi:hypothetical protein
MYRSVFSILLNCLMILMCVIKVHKRSFYKAVYFFFFFNSVLLSLALGVLLLYFTDILNFITKFIELF